MSSSAEDLLPILETLRAFLEERWAERALELNLSPPSSSHDVCGFTSHFVQRVLTGLVEGTWNVVGGIPVSETGAPLDRGGMLSSDGTWHGHYWVVREEDGVIVDLTADQFGHDAIIVSSDPDPRYVANYQSHEVDEQMRAVGWRSRQWLGTWRASPQSAMIGASLRP